MTVSKHHANGRTNYHAGQAAEQSVARLYQSDGYELAHMRWRGGGGEIDLILHGENGVVFVEVKQSRSFQRAALRISNAQKQRIFSAASAYLALLPDGLLTQTRFDVALVNGIGEVERLENALYE